MDRSSFLLSIFFFPHFFGSIIKFILLFCVTFSEILIVIEMCLKPKMRHIFPNQSKIFHYVLFLAKPHQDINSTEPNLALENLLGMARVKLREPNSISVPLKICYLATATVKYPEALIHREGQIIAPLNPE